MLGLKSWCLIKQLKHILKKIHRNEASSMFESEQQKEVKSSLHSFTKKLSQHQLESLVCAIESSGTINSRCIVLPDSVSIFYTGKRINHLHAFLCYLGRWPNVCELLDLMMMTELSALDNSLKRLQFCDSTGKEGGICCNPYHWSLLLLPGSLLHHS